MYIEEQDFAAKRIDWNVWKKLYRYALQHKKLFYTVIVALVLPGGMVSVSVTAL